MMTKHFVFFYFVFLFAACTSSRGTVERIPTENFSKLIGEQEVGLFTLTNKNGVTVELTNYGARMVSVWVPDRNGNFQDVVWGFSSIDDYLSSTDLYCGPIVGRYGNRINKGQFELNGNMYQLTINNGENHLHGGTKGFESKVWNAEMIEKNGVSAVKMSYYSKDGEEGYPGNLKIEVVYSLKANNALTIDYKASTDAPTIINPTSHTYFNLAGTSNYTILKHVLQIDADRFTPTDAGLIPTGELLDVSGTPLDFRVPTAIGERINEDYEPLIFGKGYDHNYVLNKGGGSNEVKAVIYSPETGISMSVFTDQPGIQFYSGNFMDGTLTGKYGDIHNYRTGFALECQNFPDAPNHSNFPNAVLNPGDTYTQTTSYLFSVTE